MMKIAAMVDAGNASRTYYREYMERIRRETAADAILVIMDGDFSREGCLAARDKYERTSALIEAGAAGVVEMPVCGVLLGDNQYAFAVSVMLRKLGCVDEIVLPCTCEDRRIFDQTSEFLFDEPMSYQRRMRLLRAQGADLDAALPEIVDAFVSGAGAFLREPMNRMAVEYHNILRKSYSSVKPRLLQVDGAPAVTAPESMKIQDRYLMAQVERRFQKPPEREAIAWATGMFSGSERAARRIWGAQKPKAPEGFCAFSTRMANSDMNAVTVRRYLLGGLIGYRKVDSFVCITYNYVPYIRILGWNESDGAFKERLLKKAETTVLVDTETVKDFSGLQDDCKQLLAEMDGRARALYVASMGD